MVFDLGTQDGGEHTEQVPAGVLREVGIFHDSCDLQPTWDRAPVADLDITDVSLDVAGMCNMGCTYCFENDIFARRGAMSTSTLQASLELVFENARTGTTVDIHFGSGEPLTAMDKIRESVEIAEELARQRRCDVIYDVTTNGTRVTPTVAAFLANHNFRVKVSLDGPPDLHNAHRPMLGGRASYELAKQGLDNLLDQLPPEAVTVNTVLSHGSSLRDLWAWAKTLGVRHWVTIPLGEPPEDIDRQLVEARKSALDEIARETRDALISGTAILDYEPITKVVRKLSAPAPTERYCGAGGSFVGIRSDGAVYPCLRQLGLDDHFLGDVRTGLNDEGRRSYLATHAARVNDRKFCQDCWARYLCGGGCYADSIVYGKDPKAPLGSHCDFFRLEIEAGIRLFGSLRSESPIAILKLFGDQALARFEAIDDALALQGAAYPTLVRG